MLKWVNPYEDDGVIWTAWKNGKHSQISYRCETDDRSRSNPLKLRVKSPHPSRTAASRQRAIDPEDPALGGNIIGGDPYTYHPELWSFLVERFSITSVLDVGCGEGHCVQYCSGLGLHAFGFDGLRRNVEHAVVPIILHDLRLSAFKMPVDLVHCCEVVEHVGRKYLSNIIKTLANGKVIAMTHGLPGQKGYHHVNCQPSSYWIKTLEEVGYEFLPKETEEAKSRIKICGRWTYFIQSGLILQRKLIL